MERHPLRRRLAPQSPPAIPTARHYCIREVGVLAEQGVLDRARMLLARRAQREPLVPDAFLDAIRLELAVPTSGSAWRAWLARALEGGVEIADHLAAIVPERELARGLVEIAPEALLRQASRGAALDMLRLRAAQLIADGDARAADVLQGALLEAGARDAELRELQLGVLLARALSAPDTVDRYVPVLAASVTAEHAAELQRELELARAYHRLELPGRLPPLDAALALLGRCDGELDRSLQAKLGHDLRARPGEYLAWADAAAADPALLHALRARTEPARASQPAELAGRASALAAAIARALERDARRFVPLSSTALALYREHARLKALAAIADRSLTLAALAAALRDHKAARRVVVQLEADEALGLVERIARLTA